MFLIDEYREFAESDQNEIKTFDNLELFGVDIFLVTEPTLIL